MGRGEREEASKKSDETQRKRPASLLESNQTYALVANDEFDQDARSLLPFFALLDDVSVLLFLTDEMGRYNSRLFSHHRPKHTNDDAAAAV